MELDDEEQWEPYESRGSSTVLRGAGAEMLRPTHSEHYVIHSRRRELDFAFTRATPIQNGVLLGVKIRTNQSKLRKKAAYFRI